MPDARATPASGNPTPPGPPGAGEPVAQDAQTLTEAIAALEAAGYAGQFRVLEHARVQCLTCREEFAATRTAMESLHRLEGASDPDDMLAVVAMRCPKCEARGTLVLGYGPDASLEESQLMLALQDARPDSA